MGLRDELTRRIEKKRREINELENKTKAAVSYLQALEDTLKIVREEDGQVEEIQDTPNGRESDDILRSGSKTDRAREILRSAGKPMHILKILDAMGEKPDSENRAALTGSLGAYVRDGKIFTRPAPNTFGLTEFSKKTATNPEPPPGFGIDSSDGTIDDEVPF